MLEPVTDYTPEEIVKLERIHGLAFHNKDRIEKAYVCGCFYCCKTFNPSLIKEWSDRSVKRGGDGVTPKTALCPYCNINSVLPWTIDSEFYLTEEFLHRMSWYFFEMEVEM